MKVAPIAKKTKPLHKKNLKAKGLQAGAAETKKKKETLLKGFAESSSLKENIPAPPKHFDKASAKTLNSRRNSKVLSTPSTNVDLLTSSDQALKTPIKQKSVALLTSANNSSSQNASSITKQGKKSHLNKKATVSTKNTTVDLTVTPETVKTSKKSLKKPPVPLSASSEDVEHNSTTSKKLLPERKLGKVAATDDSTSSSDTTKSGKGVTKSRSTKQPKQKVLPPTKAVMETKVSPQAKPVGQKNETRKRKKALRKGDLVKDESISEPIAIFKPNVNVVEPKNEATMKKPSRKRASSLHPKSKDSNETPKEKLPTPLAAGGDESSNEEPSPVKKKKLSRKQVWNKQTDKASITDEKPVESAKVSPKKNKLKKKKVEITVERKEVSKDSRLQNVQEAAEAVITLAKKKSLKFSKKQLFADDAQPVNLQIHTFRVPSTPPRCLRFNLPHSIHEKNADICLILADPIKGRKRDTEQDAIVEDYKEMLESKGVNNIKDVIPFNYLRAQYSQYEMKRRFASSYDVFLCDSRFVGHATHFLGQQFFHNKCVTPLRVVKQGEKKFIDDLKSAIDFSLHKTWMRVHPRGTSFNVVVGHTKLSSEQIAANVVAVFNDLQISFPGGLDSIKTALLKGHESHPVPVFVSLKPHNEAPVPVVKSINKRHGVAASGELSTLPGREVTVFPSGRIDIRNKMTQEDRDYVKVMGQESLWKRAQDRQKAKLEKLASQEEENERSENGAEDEEEDKKDFAKIRDSGFRGKKPFQRKNFGSKKSLSQGKKFTPGNKFPPGKKFSPGGKKFSPGQKTAPGKKFSPSKTAPGKKFSPSKTAPGKKFSPSKTAPGKKLDHGKKVASFKQGKKTSQKS